MTINEISGLRRQGYIEKAYDAIRKIYATDKSRLATLTMFWTAVDVLKIRVNENRMDEARKIMAALERLVGTLDDIQNEGLTRTLDACKALIKKRETANTTDSHKSQHIAMGIWGEELAAAYLREKGYVILERNWHSGHRDIDIIAKDGDCHVFVEVKTRKNTDYMEPEQAVGYQKQRNLKRAINHYLKYKFIDNPWRFDVITVVGEYGTLTPKINHIIDFSIY